MQKTLITLFIIISLSSCGEKNIYDLKPIKITEDITCVIGDFSPPNKENKGFVSNACYINMGNSLVFVEAGPTYNFAKEFSDLAKKQYPNHKITHVILSNFHDDRSMGATYFNEIGASVVGHKTITQDIQDFANKFTRIKKLTTKEEYFKTAIPKVDILVDGGYKISGTNKTIEIIKPSEVSEERSDIAVYSKDDSFVFTGNIVFNGRMLNYRGASNAKGWIEALENLAKLNAKYMLGGHGSEFDKNSYKNSLNYLKIIQKDVQKAYDDGVNIIDLKDHISKTDFEKINIPYFDRLHYKNITNYYNQLEWE